MYKNDNENLSQFEEEDDSLTYPQMFFMQMWSKHSNKLAISLILLLVWAISYSLFGEEVVGIHTELFKLSALFVLAKLSGYIMSFFEIPPMVGMLLMGILLRNTGYIEITDQYARFIQVLRQLALMCTMLPSSLGLDLKALKRILFRVLMFATIPVAAEVSLIAVGAYYLLEFSIPWSITLGLLLGAVTPAIVAPCLIKLQRLGYGTSRDEINTLMIAGSSLNDIFCIALFGILIRAIFNTKSSWHVKLLKGPLVLLMGCTFGLFWGLVCKIVPSRSENYLITLRFLLLGLGCLLSVIGSVAIGYPSAGTIGSVVSVFTTNYAWQKQGWSNQHPVRMNFLLLWKFFEPISFSLIGVEVDLKMISMDLVRNTAIFIFVPLALRIIVSLICGKICSLKLNENIFIAFSWIPKATVQAALGPVALDIARRKDNEDLEPISHSIVIIAALSILMTAPIGGIIMMQLGQKLLYKKKISNVSRISGISQLSGITNPALDAVENGQPITT